MSSESRKYIFFSGAHGTFSRIEHMLATRQFSGNLRKLKPYETSFSDHNTMRLEINYKKKQLQKKTNRAKQHVTNRSLKK